MTFSASTTADPEIIVLRRTPEMLADAQAGLPESVRAGRTGESVVARHLLSQAVARRWSLPGFVPVSDNQGAPLWEGQCFWSLAHKDEWVGVAIADRPVGIDVEVLAERHPSLFSLFSPAEWDILGERSWPNFYRLWTAKEAMIKRLRGTIDLLPALTLAWANASGVQLDYAGCRYDVRCGRSADCIYSYTL